MSVLLVSTALTHISPLRKWRHGPGSDLVGTLSGCPGLRGRGSISQVSICSCSYYPPPSHLQYRQTPPPSPSPFISLCPFPGCQSLFPSWALTLRLALPILNTILSEETHIRGPPSSPSPSCLQVIISVCTAQHLAPKTSSHLPIVPSSLTYKTPPTPSALATGHRSTWPSRNSRNSSTSAAPSAARRATLARTTTAPAAPTARAASTTTEKSVLYHPIGPAAWQHAMDGGLLHDAPCRPCRSGYMPSPACTEHL
ncbi:hypothetical protein BT67DRAFT_310169 [Trichocladium antarcticum]|uniref:Uncharacterized protein n=1 Tax=Trichocladium antarcticum TaxID=1450529 RepID=A0AAN6ZDT7_9PEZI|nr:hypothetical protein BT67DRAFT_310169 [Trichocladium antarcticum]